MTFFQLDITAHHFTSEPTRDYAREYVQTPTEAGSTVDLTCRQNAAYFLNLQLDDWLRVDDDWWACALWLRSPEGYNLGRRPALVYAHPSDVATYTMFKTQNEAITIGLRTVTVS